MYQVEDDNYKQPESTLTAVSGTVEQRKKRNQPHYKALYEQSQKRLNFAVVLAVAGWLAFAVALSYAL